MMGSGRSSAHSLRVSSPPSDAGTQDGQGNQEPCADFGGDELLTRAMLRRLVPVSDMSLWRYIKANTFPRPMKFNGRRYWRLGDVREWLERNRAQSMR